MIRTPFFVAVILSVSAGIRIYRIRHTPSSVLLSPSTVSLSSVLCLSVSLSLCLSVLRPPSSLLRPLSRCPLSLCLSVLLRLPPFLRPPSLRPPSLRPPPSSSVSPSSSVFFCLSVFPSFRLSVLPLSLSLLRPPSSVLRPPSSVLRPPSLSSATYSLVIVTYDVCCVAWI